MACHRNITEPAFTGCRIGRGLLLGLSARRTLGGTLALAIRGKPFYCCSEETSSSTRALN